MTTKCTKTKYNRGLTNYMKSLRNPYTKKQIKLYSNPNSSYNTNSNSNSTIHSNMDSLYNNNFKTMNNQSSNLHNMNQQNLYNLVNTISQERKNRTKAQSNLPARLMKLTKKTKPKKTAKSNSYSRSVSSTYSSIIKNGESHNKGKKIVNESTKPYLQIDEMENGQVQHYMIPKNTIHYKGPGRIKNVLPMHMPKSMFKPIRMTMRMPKKMKIPMDMQLEKSQPTILVYTR